ncbi:MAG: hypothetical protein OXC38_07100 [Gammaproteobacteria bacterium]|nr:hypothetical protein [Gammaproteobacteria bacterium]
MMSKKPDNAPDLFHAQLSQHLNLRHPLVRLFTGPGEAGLKRLRRENGGRKKTLNVRHALTRLGQNLTALLLQAVSQAQILDRFHDALVQVRAAIRPERAYPRVSRKPTGKWKPEKAPKAFSSA